MRLLYFFIACFFLFEACIKEKIILKDNEVKLIIKTALSHRKFYPLLQSMAIDSFNLTINKKITDSIHIKKIVVFINLKKNKPESEKIILANIDSIGSKERILKLTCGNFDPPGNKIYGKFKITFLNKKWIITPLDIGVIDYR